MGSNVAFRINYCYIGVFQLISVFFCIIITRLINFYYGRI